MQDGYTKYRCHHQLGMAPTHELLTALNELRTSLFVAGLVGKYKDGPGYGNVSLRNRAQSFIISATNTGAIQQLEAGGYCLVNNWNINNNSVECLGPLPASSETLTHGAIYEASPAVNCVAHIHSSALFNDLLRRGNHPGTEPQALYGTPDMARSVINLVTKQPKRGIIVMVGHDEGLLAYGESVQAVWEAIDNIHPLPTMG